MNNYETLKNVLNRIRFEAPPKFIKYLADKDDEEKVNQALSRAYIHLFLKVKFGLLDFTEREYFVTDGTHDGGIDGYFIDSDSKTITFIQSKFRINEKNFESKKIKLSEILSMETDRILGGETHYENGSEFNGKIKQLQRDISVIDDIGRYRYVVILLANVDKKITGTKLKILSGGLPVEIFDFDRCYQELLFPVVSGTYYNATDLNININLSHKSSGSKISYTVQTEFKECEITVLFAPTIEIAKILRKYKNSILKYNPRSYLEIQGKNVNNAIKETITNKDTNEFALFNNGITLLSDETFLNEKIGQKDKAQLTVKNPQIINGGQTAFTLSKVLEENLDNSEIFKGKEVLLKVITFLDDEIDVERKRTLIRDISKATNQQTTVTHADRRSNDEIQILIQDVLFEKLGIFYERKRGEFSEGISEKYISIDDVLVRSVFSRLFYIALGDLSSASTRKRIFLKSKFTREQITDEIVLEKFKKAYHFFKIIEGSQEGILSRNRITSTMKKIHFSMIIEDHLEHEKEEGIVNVEMIESHWIDFMKFVRKQKSNEVFLYFKKNRRTGDLIEKFREIEYLKRGNIRKDFKTYLNKIK